MTHHDQIKAALTGLALPAEGLFDAYCLALSHLHTHGVDSLPSFLQAELRKDYLKGHAYRASFGAACRSVLALLAQPLAASTAAANQAVLEEWDRHGVDGYQLDPLANWIQFDQCALCRGLHLSVCTGHSYDLDALDRLEEAQAERTDS